MKSHLFGDAELTDISDETALLPSGPMSLSILGKLTDEAHLPVKYYTFKEDVNVSGISCMISRTAYTPRGRL